MEPIALRMKGENPIFTTFIKRIFSFFPLAIIIMSLVNCGGSGSESPIEKEIAKLRKEIAKYQRSEVWCGGNEYSGCYMWTHRKKFLASGGLNRIRKQALGNKSFMRGVIALKSVPAQAQRSILAELSKPIDPTWAETGKVGKGTTEAGQLTESDIAEELVSLIQELLPQTNEKIEQTWLANLPWTNRFWGKIFGAPSLLDK